MKKLKSDMFLKIFGMFIVVFLLLFIIAYAISKHFLLSLSLADPSLLESTLMSFNLVWLKISLVFFILMILVYFFVRYITKRIYKDVDAISEYVYEISENKNYDKSLKISNYLEFLQLSVYLKNITKRLVQKDKKSSKK